MRRIAPLLLLLTATAAAPAPGGWRTPDPANLLVIDSSRGRIVIEMEPRVAPRAVERVRFLAHRGTYDGLLFHRVIDKFVAQTGNPNNHDGGGTELPNLKPEFWVPKATATQVRWLRTDRDGSEGVIGSLPVARGTDPVMPAWIPQCGGIAGMGRQANPDTANSELYFTRTSVRGLDHDYTVFGRVLAGQDIVEALNVGEPPAKPDRMIRVRTAADLPVADRPHLQVIDPNSAEYGRWLAAKRRSLGAGMSICDAMPPVRSES